METIDKNLLTFPPFSYLGTESAEEGEPEMAQRKCKVLVEEVAEEFAHPGMEKGEETEKAKNRSKSQSSLPHFYPPL